MNVSRHHFLGGFFGGVTGILVGYLISPIALPFGCFIGAFFGMFYREFYKMLVEFKSLHKERVTKLQARPEDKRATSVLYTARWAAAITVIVIATTCGALIDGHEGAFGLLCMSGILQMFAVMYRETKIGIPFYRDLKTLDDMRDYYTLIGEYKSLGTVRMFLKEFAISVAVGAFITVVAPVAIFVTMWAVIISVVIGLPFASIRYVATVIYTMLTSPSYVTCAVVTTITTATIAWLAFPFVNVLGLWLIAFVAGCVSGALSVLAHKYLGKVLEKKPRTARAMRRLETVTLFPFMRWVRLRWRELVAPKGWQYS